MARNCQSLDYTRLKSARKCHFRPWNALARCFADIALRDAIEAGDIPARA